MNETSAELLQGLVEARENLAETLNNKNVVASNDEELGALVEKVSKIHGGVEFGEWLPTVNTAGFMVSNLPFVPRKIGISCEALAGQSLLAEATRFIALFAAGGNGDPSSLYSSNEGEMSMNNVPEGAVVTVGQAENGTYTVTVDFSDWNDINSTAYMFKGGYEYMWVVSEEGWSL